MDFLAINVWYGLPYLSIHNLFKNLMGIGPLHKLDKNLK